MTESDVQLSETDAAPEAGETQDAEAPADEVVSESTRLEQLEQEGDIAAD